MTRLEELKRRNSANVNNVPRTGTAMTRLDELKAQKGLAKQTPTVIYPSMEPKISKAKTTQPSNTLTFKNQAEALEYAKKNNLNVINPQLPTSAKINKENIFTNTALKNNGLKEIERSNKGFFKTPENMKDNLRRFEDGYNFGDATMTGLETLGEAALGLVNTGAEGVTRVAKGVLSVPENMARAGASLVAGGADLLGADNWANQIRYNVANKDVLTGWADKPIESLNKNSFSGNLTDSVTEGIGQGAAQIATSATMGGANVPIKFGKHVLKLPVTAFASGAGSSAKEAYSKTDLDNMTLREKVQNAGKIVGGGTIEAVTEGLFGLFGVGGSDITDELVIKTMTKAKTEFGKTLAKITTQGGGEAVEEFLSYAGNYLLDNGVLDKIGNIDYSKNWDWEEVFTDMASAFLSTGILGGGTAIYENAISKAEKQVGRILTPEEQAEIKSQIDAIIKEENAQNQPNIEQNSQNNVQNIQNFENTVQNDVKIDDDTQKFSTQVDTWKNKEWDESKDLVVLEHTPQLYKDLGLRDLPITLDASKLNSIYNESGRGKKNYHGLKELVKQIPEALKNPLNIVESTSRDNSIVVITSLSDDNGQIITVPIAIDDQGDLSIEDYLDGKAVNKMSSAYGRENYDYNVDKNGNYYDGWMEDNKKNNRIVYDIDDGIIKKRVNGRWLQLPNAVDSESILNDASINNIIQSNENYVNNQKNTQELAQPSSFSLPTQAEQKQAQSRKITSIQVTNAIKRALTEKTSKGRVNLGKITENTKNKIKDVIGIDVGDRNHLLLDNDIRHMKNEHGNQEVENKKGQIAITEKDIEMIPDIIENYNDIVPGSDNKQGKTIRYIKNYPDNTSYVVEVIPRANNKSLYIKTMWKKPITLTNNTSVPSSTSETRGNMDSSTTIDNIIHSNEDYVNNEENVKVAKLLEKNPLEKKSFLDNYHKLTSHIVNKGYAVDRLANITGNQELKYKYDKMLSSTAEGNYVVGKAQTNNEGRKIGKSINEIWAPVEKADKVQEFSEYLLHKLNVERMSLKNPKAEQDAVNAYNEFILEHPEFATTPQWQIREWSINEEADDYTTNLAKEYYDLLNEVEKQKMIKNKPVFGETITANDSRRYVEEAEKNNPIFKEWSEEINKFNKNQLQNMVDAGLTSEETQEILNTTYDNYIRIQRDKSKGSKPITNNRGRLKVNSPIKKATGGNSDIKPLKYAMAQQAIEVKKAIARNEFGLELLKTLGNGVETKEYGQVLKPRQKSEAPTFTVFKNGKPIAMKINDDLYNAIKPAERSNLEDNILVKGLQKGTQIHRELLTSKNPVFSLTNPVRDIQTAVVNSKDTTKMLKNYGRLVKYTAEAKIAQPIVDFTGKLLKKDFNINLGNKNIRDYWDLYLASGGESNSYFDIDKGTKQERPSDYKRTKGEFLKDSGKWALGKIEAINQTIEQLPRVAEFITTLEKGGTTTQALYNAADVTTNFKRGGELAKAIDRNGVSFLNASIQGLDKQIRNFTEGGAKGAAKMVIKSALLGITPSLINHLLMGDDEDYEALPDYIKDGYWLIKTEDDNFIRIPKGRDIPAFLGNIVQRTTRAIQGDEKAFDGLVETFTNSLAPNNPLTNNISSPLLAVGSNKAWHGGDIVSTSLENKVNAQQYDAKTTEFSKWIGGKLNISPKKLDYLIDQYSGGIGDIFMPMNTKYAEERNALTSKFSTDSINNNKYVSRFYDEKEKLSKLSNSNLANENEKYQLKYLNDVNDEISKLSKEKREIESSDLTDEQKIEKVNNIQKEINKKSKDAVENYKKYGEISEKYAKDKKIKERALIGITDETTEEAKEDRINKYIKLHADREMFGTEYALREYDKDVLKKYDEIKNYVSLEDFYNAWMAQKEATGTKNIYGVTISGSESKNKVKAIKEATNLSYKDRIKLYQVFKISNKYWN